MFHGCVELVQAFLLMGHYFQNSDMSGACWNCVGVAVRVAQTLGLDVEALNPFPRESDVDGRTVTEIDLRRRLWGGCVMFDR